MNSFDFADKSDPEPRPAAKSQEDASEQDAQQDSVGETGSSSSFPIIAIGASAGGLDSFSQLLRNMPADLGSALVLIQHLAPEHESRLTELLAKTTSLEVQEVTDGMEVEPNYVYVIPPDTNMAIAPEGLKLLPRQSRHTEPYRPIDYFFRSLADLRGSQAIGVILSGTGGDGTQGLKAIKDAGGITFAQEEQSAQFDGMPHSAILAGCVDLILPPAEIATELARISQCPYVLSGGVRSPAGSTGEEITPTADDLGPICQILKQATGVNFSAYKPQTIRRRTLRRMALKKIDRMSDYARYLQEQPAEVAALYEDVLINVTSFFRDLEVFEALKTKVFPSLVEQRNRETPIRIWVAGCSTGEEAYSLIICLQEFLDSLSSNIPIQVFATDINETAIEQARSGIYLESMITGLSPERLQRWFTKVDTGYQMSKMLRNACVFAKHNLVGDPPFSNLDLISCRNLLIYLGSDLQKQVIPLFHYALKPKGCLVLGNSETIGEFSNLFTSQDKPHKIYTKKPAQVRPNFGLISGGNRSPHLGTMRLSEEAVWSEQELLREADRLILANFAPANVIINDHLEILFIRGQTRAYLEPSTGKASLNILKMVRPSLQVPLRTAIAQAKQQGMPIKRERLLMQADAGPVREVTLEVIPIKAPLERGRYFLVVFEAIPQPELPPVQNRLFRWPKSAQDHKDREIAQLREELAASRQSMQAMIEQEEATTEELQAASEEMLSSNEELQSINEELETSKEELQATNEELNTVNEELQIRNNELTQVNSDLNNLFGSVNIPIVMLDRSLCIRRFTLMAKQVLSLIPADMGRSISDIRFKTNSSNLDLEPLILQVMNSDTVQEQEVQDQQGRHYCLQIRPYKVTESQIEGAILVLIDIEALKRSQQELHRYAESIVETVQEPLVLLDSTLRVLSANYAFYQIFQVSAAESEQRLFFELGNGQWNIPDLRSQLTELLRQNLPVLTFEVEHQFETIGYKVMRITACKIRPEAEVPTLLVAIADITEIRQAEAERQQLLVQVQQENRNKDEFLAILSHELRTPLTALIGGVQLLRIARLGPERQAQALDMIERNAKLQTQIINDLQDISQIARGRIQMQFSSQDVGTIIRTTLEGFQADFEAKQMQLIVTLPAEPLRIWGDYARLHQVLWNLLSNAIKFSSTGGQIEVTLTQVDADAEIRVSDLGEGISADFLPFLFERFRQSDSSSTRRHGGMGLGLAIVKQVVERHNGTVRVFSAGPGQGAMFIVRLPLVELPELAQRESPPSPSAATRLEGLRILLVEDAADVRSSLVILLRVYGAEVQAVASVQQAIATFPQFQPDVLVSDIGMPKEDGYALIRRVRAWPADQGGDILAVAMTGYGSEQDRQQALTAGFQEHVSKPVDANELANLISTLVRR